MNNVPKKIIHYYAKINPIGFAYKKCTREMPGKKYVLAKNHNRLGYVFEVYLDELEEIKKTKKLKLTVWPDNDSYHFTDDFEITEIIKEQITYKDILND